MMQSNSFLQEMLVEKPHETNDDPPDRLKPLEEFHQQPLSSKPSKIDPSLRNGERKKDKPDTNEASHVEKKDKLFSRILFNFSRKPKNPSEASSEVQSKKTSTANASESQHGVTEIRKSIQKSWHSIFHQGKISESGSTHSSHEGSPKQSGDKRDMSDHHVVPNDEDSKDREISFVETDFLSKYHFCGNRIIGKGASSVVRLAEGAKDHNIYAVKEFRKRRKDESQRDYMKKLTSEYCISSLFHHPNIVETFDILRDGNHWYEVMEYCPGGDLFTIIRDGFLELEDVDICFKELLLGVQYLHSMGVAHRDLKPENLLVDSHGHLKITDFGVSEVFHVVWEKAPHLSKGICGSAPYIAPEVLSGSEYDASKMDIWACAIIYYAMKFHGIPWALASPKDPNYSQYVKHRGFGAEPLVRLARGPQTLLRKMLEPDPKTRLSIEQVLEDSWVKSVPLESKNHFAQLLSSKRMKKSLHPI
jgi:protein-serine/threonine kinase